MWPQALAYLARWRASPTETCAARPDSQEALNINLGLPQSVALLEEIGVVDRFARNQDEVGPWTMRQLKLVSSVPLRYHDH
jgi:hypothetical protein